MQMIPNALNMELYWNDNNSERLALSGEIMQNRHRYEITTNSELQQVQMKTNGV